VAGRDHNSLVSDSGSGRADMFEGCSASLVQQRVGLYLDGWGS